MAPPWCRSLVQATLGPLPLALLPAVRSFLICSLSTFAEGWDWREVGLGAPMGGEDS